MKKLRYLVATIPQIDGGTRKLYMHGRRRAAEAREEIRRNPAMIDGIGPDEIVDVAAPPARVEQDFDAY